MDFSKYTDDQLDRLLAAPPEQLPQVQSVIDNEIKFGNSEGLAALAGAGRGVSFGLSDQLLTKTGLVDPETLRGLQEANPVASTIGEVGGAAASLLVPGSPVARAAQLSSKIAAKAAPNIAKVLGTTVKSPLVKTIAEKAGALAIGSSAEGALYGLGQSVSEEALGDPDLNAEKILSNIGYGALFGGAAGGLLGGAEAALPSVINNAKKAQKKVFDTVFGTPGEVGNVGKAYAKASSFVTGKPEESILDLLKNKELTLTTNEQKDKLASQFADALQNQYKSIDDLSKQTSQKMRPKESELLVGRDRLEASQLARTEFERVSEALNNSIQEMVENEALYPRSFAFKVNKLREDFVNQALKDGDNNAVQIFKAIDDLKGNLDKRLKFGKIPTTEEQDAIRLAENLRRELKTSLENEKAWGSAASRQSQYNDAVNDYLTNKKEFQKRFMYKTTNRSGRIEYKVDPVKVRTFFNQISDPRGQLKGDVLNRFLKSSDNVVNQVEQTYQTIGSPFQRKELDDLAKATSAKKSELEKIAEVMNDMKEVAGQGTFLEAGAGAATVVDPVLGGSLFAYNTARNPTLTIKRLATIERSAQKATQIMNKAIKGIFTGSVSIGKGLKGITAQQLIPESDFYKQVSDLSQNPELLIERVAEKTEDIAEEAPLIAQGAQNTMIRATSFLASKLPQQNKSALQPNYIPSKAEVAKFKRYYDAVEDPLSVLNQIAKGTLTPEPIEALQSVYPKLYIDMVQGIMDQLSDKKKTKYSTKMSLSLFLNQDLVDSLNQPNIMGNQASFAQSRDENNIDNGMRVTQTGLSNLDRSQAMLTPMQKSNLRLES